MMALIETDNNSSLCNSLPAPGQASSTWIKGFTLVEIAIVLVIVGAIFLSILKVGSVVQDAKIRQTIKQYRDLHAAVLSYRNKYGYLPGDDPKANTRFIIVGNAARSGNGDGYISNGVSGGTAYYEYNYDVVDHLSKAGLIKVNAAVTPLIPNPFGGVTNAKSYLPGAQDSSSDSSLYYNKSGLAIYMTNLPGDVAQAIDTNLDDGVNSTGSCVTNNSSFTASPVTLVCFIE